MPMDDQHNAAQERTEQARERGRDPSKGDAIGFDVDEELRREPGLLERAQRNQKERLGHPPAADREFASMEARVRGKLSRKERLTAPEAEFFARLHSDHQIPAEDVREKGTQDVQ